MAPVPHPSNRAVRTSLALIGGRGRGPARQAIAQRHWQSGSALMKRGEAHWPEALRLFQRATEADPKVALYWVNLANAQRKMRLQGEALESARRAFELDPSDRLACHLLVELLRQHNRRPEAVEVLKAFEGQRDADTWWLEGDLLFSLNRAEAAAQSLLQVLVMQPGHKDAYMKLGFALAWLKQFGSAAECFRTVTMMDPTQLGAAAYAVHYASWGCDFTQARDDLVRLNQSLALTEGEGSLVPVSPFCLLPVLDDPQLQRRMAERESARLLRELDQRIVRAEATDAGTFGGLRAVLAAGGRIRIGFVACDFRDHATSILMVRLVELLDRQRFEVRLYSHGERDGSGLGDRIAEAADAFIDCRHLSPAEQAERIRADGVAVLIDLGGFTLNSRLQMFALRPAPIQACWLAYPGTTGAPWIDYLIGDPVVSPILDADDFSEKIAQLPMSYQANDARRPHPETVLSRTEAGLPEDAFVYACFNQSYKITEPVFDAWCRILQRVPQAVLWLLVPEPEVQQRLRDAARRREVDPDRLIFAPFVKQAEHLARLPLADVALDTFPCGAHTTCSDALWMGVPMVTRLGHSFASRVATSLLRGVGLEGLAVVDPVDYEELAVRLANDREALTDIRDHLWDLRLDLPLFDSEGFTRDFGALMQRMVDRWLDGQAPDHLPADTGAQLV